VVQARNIFGFVHSDNIGKSSFPAVQAAPSFSSAFNIPLKGIHNMPCLIPCAIDQVMLFLLLISVSQSLKFLMFFVFACLFRMLILG
jgi:tryptophanyl-tRNA synthetase